MARMCGRTPRMNGMAVGATSLVVSLRCCWLAGLHDCIVAWLCCCNVAGLHDYMRVGLHCGDAFAAPDHERIGYRPRLVAHWQWFLAAKSWALSCGFWNDAPGQSVWASTKHERRGNRNILMDWSTEQNVWANVKDRKTPSRFPKGVFYCFPRRFRSKTRFMNNGFSQGADRGICPSKTYVFCRINNSTPQRAGITVQGER